MQRLPRLVELLLAVALVALIALWVTRFLRGESLAVPPSVAPSFDGGPAARINAALASARLFGSRPPGALSDNVRALGVVADAGGNGSVIVSVDGQAPKVYRVGDTLDGRTVSAIRPDRIELDARGARQVFQVPRQATVAGVNTPSVAPVLPRVVPTPAPYTPPMMPPPPVYDQNGVPTGPPVRDSRGASPDVRAPTEPPLSPNAQ